MARYYVNVDITMSKGIVVEAKNEAEAMEKVDNMIGENPYNYTNDFTLMFTELMSMQVIRGIIYEALRSRSVVTTKPLINTVK